MPVSILKRPRADDPSHRHPAKKIRKSKKQLEYHSSSEEDEEEKTTDFSAVNLHDSDTEETITAKNTFDNSFVAQKDDTNDAESILHSQSSAADSDDEEKANGSDITGASSDDNSDASTTGSTRGKKRKRNDPTAFATSISKILSSKLTTTKRADPVLARSKDAAIISKDLTESKLELRARQKLRLERKSALEKGRIRDVLGLEESEVSTEGIMETERRLKKTAQRGVVKLFNAVREAQKRGEEAKREALREGVVGMDRREEKVSEMSKKGFLELIASGGPKKRSGSVDV